MIEFADIQYYEKEDIIKILKNICNIIDDGESTENWERIKKELCMQEVKYDEKTFTHCCPYCGDKTKGVTKLKIKKL